MSREKARCPRCGAKYPWGATVCSACHVALERGGAHPAARPAVLVFETWDRPSRDIVVSVLEAHGVPCLVRATGESAHPGIGPASFWRVFVRASDEQLAQQILDAEIGREEGE